MASENHPSYTKVGFTVIIGLAAAAFALVYLAGIDDKANEFLVETYYDNPVSGLSVGSAVNFRGVKVGEVREINFFCQIYDIKEDIIEAQRVSIVMALDLRVSKARGPEEFNEIIHGYVTHGLRATVSSSGITGLSRIELNIPDDPSPCPDMTWVPRYPLIPPQPSLMENFAVSATRILNEINRTDFQSVWSNISVVAESSAKLTQTANALIERERTGIDSIVRNVDQTSAAINDLVGRLRDNPSLLLRPSDPERLDETE